MNTLLLDDTQIEFATLITEVLEDRSPVDKVQQLVNGSTPFFDQALWKTLVGVGVTEIRLPEDGGGMGLNFRESGLIAEQIARALAPVPYLSTGIVASCVLLSLPRNDELLSDLANGAPFALAVSDNKSEMWSMGPSATRASEDGGVWSVTGVKHLVLGAAEAAAAEDGRILVVAEADDEPVLLAIRALDAAVVQSSALGLTRSWSTVTLDAVPATLLGRGDEVLKVINGARAEFETALALEQAGIASVALELTVEYLRTRIQFAQPIGSFQAVKHTCADLAVLVDQIRTAADHAARSVAASHDTDGPAEESTVDSVDEAVALANAVCHSRAETVVFESMQLLGGIGFTWEHPMPPFVRRASANARMVGRSGALQETYLRLRGY